MLAALLAVSLLLPTSSVLATPYAPATEPTAPVQTEANCNSPSGWRDFAGMENTTSNISASRSGAQAIIDISYDQFDICNNSGISGLKGPSAWIGVEAHGTRSDSFNLVQIGVIECQDLISSACDGENNPRFFYAWGRGGSYCAWPPKSPVPTDLGAANYGPHVFSVFLDYDNYWHFVIDGAAPGTTKHQHVSNGSDGVGCWAEQGLMRKAAFVTERADEGDSTGGQPFTNRTTLEQARYGRYGLGWFNPLWDPSANCHGETLRSRCDINGDDDLSFWTVQ